MKVSEIYNTGNYLKALDLAHKGPVLVRIVDATCESFRDDGGSPKVVLSFEGCRRRLVVNKTSATVLAEAYGDEVEEWMGKRVRLSVHKVQFNGKVVDGINVEAVDGQAVRTPAPRQATPPTYPNAGGDPGAPGPSSNPSAGGDLYPGEEVPF